MKIAVLISRSSGSRTLLRFGETVAKNRGIHIRLFESETEGLDWLRILKDNT